MADKTKPLPPPSGKKALDILKDCHSKGEPCNGTCDKYSKYLTRPLSAGQSPVAAILSCADSRVVPEEIFCAPPGALFVVRTAGNVADTNGIASLEYAVNVLGVRLVVVLGHESCGAVKAACEAADRRTEPLTPSLYHLAADIFPAIVETCGCKPEKMPKLVKKNATYAAQVLRDTAEFAEGTLITSAYYKWPTDARPGGKVKWL